MHDRLAGRHQQLGRESRAAVTQAQAGQLLLRRASQPLTAEISSLSQPASLSARTASRIRLDDQVARC